MPKKNKQTRVKHCDPFTDNPNFTGVQPGIPDCHKVRLTYSSYANFGLTTGTFGQQLISGNSLFDPDATTTGEQPYWFDTWKILYNKYRVYKSSVQIRVINTGAIAADVVIAPTVNATNGADIYEMAEWPNARKLTVVSINGNGLASCKLEANTSTVIGVTDSAVRDEEDYAALISGNPATRWYWNVGVQGIGGYTTTIGITVEYRVTYWAVLYQPTLAGDSFTHLRDPRVKPTITGSSRVACGNAGTRCPPVATQAMLPCGNTKKTPPCEGCCHLGGAN